MATQRRSHLGADLETVPGESHASRLLQRADMRLARASSGFVVGALCFVFLVAWGVGGFDSSWAMYFEVAAAAMTVVMVFVLHHNQRRSLSALQLKLDELVRSSPEADDRYVRVQDAEDEELFAMEREHVEHYEAVRQHES